MSLKEVKWIFFDLGETLIDETPPIDESIRQFVTGSPHTVTALRPRRCARRFSRRTVSSPNFRCGRSWSGLFLRPR
ncbi:hypothetical protein LJK87_15035 [Paenibacillus sp. P25]|nr:hypothetical protein LJK87_15035 [Paenibacillus sp. P25]